MENERTNEKKNNVKSKIKQKTTKNEFCTCNGHCSALYVNTC